MKDLLRSTLNAPSTPLDTRRVKGKTNRTTRVLGQLAKLGADGIQVYSEEHEKNMVRRARNDLVNGTINEDLTRHEAAYAQTVATGSALERYNAVKTKIENGEYNDIEPGRFQELMEQEHIAYKESRKASPWAKLESAKYDDFMLKNEPTLVAGQSGKYRAGLKTKQLGALNKQMHELLQVPDINADQIIKAVSQNNYTMLGANDLMEAALQAGAMSGDKVLLEKLNDEFNYSTNPKMHKKYNAAMALIDRQDRADNKEGQLVVLNRLKEMQANGEPLTMDLYNEVIKDNKQLQHEDGRDLLSVKEYANMMWQSSNANDRKKVQSAINLNFSKGIRVGNETPAQLDKAAEAMFEDFEMNKVDGLIVASTMGGLSKANSTVIKRYKTLGDSWRTEDPVDQKTGEVNEQWKNDFFLLQEYKKTAGDVMFYKHLDEATASDFRLAESFYNSGSPETRDAKLKTAAINIGKAQAARDANQTIQTSRDTPSVVAAVSEAMEDLYTLDYSIPFIGGVRGDAFSDEAYRNELTQYAMYLRTNGLATDDTLEDAMKIHVKENYTIVGGNLQKNNGKDMNQLFGGDPDDKLSGYAEIRDINVNPKDSRIVVDTENQIVRVIDRTTTSEKKIPMQSIRRNNLRESLVTMFDQKELTIPEHEALDAEFDELSAKDLQSAQLFSRPDPGAQDPIGAAVHTVDISDVTRNADAKRLSVLRSYLVRQDDLNAEYGTQYINNPKMEFDYDAEKLTPEEWGKLDANEKTIERMKGTAKFEEGNKTTQEFFDNVEKRREHDAEDTPYEGVNNMFSFGKDTIKEGISTIDDVAKVLGEYIQTDRRFQLDPNRPQPRTGRPAPIPENSFDEMLEAVGKKLKKSLDIGLSRIGPGSAGAAELSAGKTFIDPKDKTKAPRARHMAKVRTYENNPKHKNSGYNVGTKDEKKGWYPHESVEKGTKTIAYGHKLSAADQKAGSVEINGTRIKFPLSEFHAKALFRQDYIKHSNAAKKSLKYFNDFPLKAQEAVVDLVFNFGLPGLKTKMPGAYKALVAGRLSKAADELKWVNTATKKKTTKYWQTAPDTKRAVTNYKALKAAAKQMPDPNKPQPRSGRKK